MLSKEQLENTLEFKVIKGAIKKKYPFVVGVTVDKDYQHYETSLFIDIILDLKKFEEYMGEPIGERTQLSLPWHLKLDKDYSTAYLSLWYDRDETLKEKAQLIKRDIDDKIRTIHTSITDIVSEPHDILPYYMVHVSTFIVPHKLLHDYVYNHN